MIHELKTWPKYFDAVLSGDKTFEVRKNDRNYQVNDRLILNEYDPDKKECTGRSIIRYISYILSDPQYVKEGYVILGMRRVQ